MQDVNLKLLMTFSTRVKQIMREDFESSMEWKLYDRIQERFTPIRILVSSTPYKLNQ